MIDFLNAQHIAATYELIAPHIRHTPIIDISLPQHDRRASLKLELLQHAGSFKPRGAFANLLTREIGPAGVAAASGGNHGAAVAYAAGQLGIPAHIFVPEISSPSKIERIRQFGAELTISGARYADALAACEAHMAATGAVSVHAYNAEETLLGQATIGLELERQLDDIDTILIAVGGGGLIAGTAGWFAGRTKIIGVETHGCATLHTALNTGKPTQISPQGIAADALGASMIGEMAFDIAKRHVDHVCLVGDDDVCRAQNWLWTHSRLVCEPAGAAAFAALLSGAYMPAKDERLAVVLCGGNIDLLRFNELISTSKES